MPEPQAPDFDTIIELNQLVYAASASIAQGTLLVLGARLINGAV